MVMSGSTKVQKGLFVILGMKAAIRVFVGVKIFRALLLGTALKSFDLRKYIKVE